MVLKMQHAGSCGEARNLRFPAIGQRNRAPVGAGAQLRGSLAATTGRPWSKYLEN